MTFRRPLTQTAARVALRAVMFWRRDRPDRPLCEQMRALWGVPNDWTQPASTARVVPNKKPTTIAEWKQAYERKVS